MLAILGGLLMLVGTLLGVLYNTTQSKLKEHAMKLDEASRVFATKEELKDIGRRLETGLYELKEEIKAGNKTQTALLLALVKGEQGITIDMPP